jgi:hypothetical protein
VSISAWYLQAIPSEHFWASNPDLASATRKYVLDIASSVPVSPTTRTVIGTSRKTFFSSAISGIFLISNPWFAGIALAPLGFPVAWYAQKALKPVAGLLTKNIDTRIENAIQAHRQRGYADLLLEALDLRTQMPESIQNGNT